MVRSIFGDTGAVRGGRKKSEWVKKQFGQRKVKLTSLEFFSYLFRLFPAPTNWPWIFKDGLREASISDIPKLLLHLEVLLHQDLHLLLECKNVF